MEKRNQNLYISLFILLINENIETPILNFQKLGAKLSSIKSYIKYKLLDAAHKIGSITQIYYETLEDIENRGRKTKY